MSTYVFGEAAQPTMPDLAVDGNLEAFLLQLQQQQSAQATKQQEHDRLIHALQQRASEAEEALTEMRQQQLQQTNTPELTPTDSAFTAAVACLLTPPASEGAAGEGKQPAANKGAATAPTDSDNR